jgi:hypothetical protein
MGRKSHTWAPLIQCRKGKNPAGNTWRENRKPVRRGRKLGRQKIKKRKYARKQS